MLRSEGDRLLRVIVCTPDREYFNVGDLEKNNINEIADRDLTRRQHEEMQRIMREAGCEVIDAPELVGHPNSVFPRDVALSTPKGYVKLRMGLPTRRGEEAWMAKILEGLGEPCAGEITEPGTIEGGDIILAGSVAFVGLSKRTNEEGARQLAVILSDMDCDVRTIPVPDHYLHVGGPMSVIAPGRVLCSRDVDWGDSLRGFDLIEVEAAGPSTGNVICLNENEVIANATENMAAIEVLQSSGVKVHKLDLSEFRKGAGGPTCMVLPVQRG